MKTHSIIILLLLSVNTLFSQDFDSYYKYATTNRDYTSSINFGNKKILKKDFLNWLQENKQNFYTDVSIKEKSVWTYGSLKTFVTDAIFVKDENKYAYVDYLKRLKEQERIQLEEQNKREWQSASLIISGTIGFGKALFGSIKDALTSPSSDNYSSSQSSNSNESNSSSNSSNSSQTKEVLFKIIRKNACAYDCSESYEYIIYVNNEKHSTRTLGKRMNGEWKTDCPGSVMGTTYICNGGDFFNAAKKHYEQYIGDKNNNYKIEY